MADPQMSDAEYAAYKPYVEEVIALVNQHIGRHPEPKVLEAAWRMGMMTALVDVMRASRLLPDQIDEYLRQFCDAIIADTKWGIRDWDEHGPAR